MLYSKSTLILIALATLAAAIPMIHENAGLSERLEPCEKSRIKDTITVGNGNPHQNFAYKQVSGVTDCTDNPSGSAAVTETQTVSYSFSISGSVDFITGGFDVSESTSTGYTNSFGCATTKGAQTGSLCVFERIQLTAYTVNTETCVVDTCGDDTCTNDTGPNTIIYAPNSIQGSCFYDNFQLNLPCGLVGLNITFTMARLGATIHLLLISQRRRQV